MNTLHTVIPNNLTYSQTDLLHRAVHSRTQFDAVTRVSLWRPKPPPAAATLQDQHEDALREKDLAHHIAISQQQEEVEQLTLENRQLYSENKKLEDELEEALDEKGLAHQVVISQQHEDKHKRDQLTLEVHQLASEIKMLQEELENALDEKGLAHQAAISKQHEDIDKLDQLTQENLDQLDSKNKKLQYEVRDALELAEEAVISQHHTDRDKLDQLTQENHKLASENKRLQG
ncbi:unnamed protein product [Pleuronectes platessa]|uniref:Uncharacterized protein n=1 Tax=Pleuronectes platessa TaxID=8262 RepID=A0A9N7Y8E8_PLEPL|nr:unnamed protein product [Pleuronectes platessa]